MHWTTVVRIFSQYVGPAIGLGALLVACMVGFLLGRRQMKLQMHSRIIELQDRVEWEKARTTQLTQQLAEAKQSEKAHQENAPANERSVLGVMRHEVDRLRDELQRAWDAQNKAQSRAQELETRISVLVSRPERNVAGAADEEPPRLRKAGNDNVLTLWGGSESSGPRPSADEDTGRVVERPQDVG